LGNGYFATRGAVADAIADGVRYPGTYLAGGYNRLVTDIAGRAIEHEDLVNLPNWLPLSVGAQEGSTTSWIGPRTGAEVLLYRRTLDLRRGLLHCVGRFRDAEGRVTRLEPLAVADAADAGDVPGAGVDVRTARTDGGARGSRSVR
jgi:alpha,alpha-trehalase